MSNHFYKKSKKKDTKKIARLSGLGMLTGGLLIGLYIFFPLLSWQFYLAPVFANASYASPIPKNNIISKNYLSSLIQNTANSFSGVDYNNASNWLPPEYREVSNPKNTSSYYISIPKLNIENAIVSTISTDLGTHLVHFPGTAIPPTRGTAAVFGHSTLPQLYNSKDYKTIFANIHELTVGDTILVTVNNTLHTYKIFSMEITDPDDTSYLTQSYDSSYLDIVTCTPPGTTWKRLIVKTRLEKS